MHYYQFNIADYRSATTHLSNEEDLAYRRLLDMYYDSEQRIPLDTQWVAKRLRLGCEVVDIVLQDMFVKQENGWFHGRCEEVIEAYHAMAEKNRANGRLGGRRKNPVGIDSQPIAKATINQEPITINHKPIKESKRGSRLANNWVMPEEWENWSTKERPDLDAKQVFEQFKDYWCAKAGKDAIKLDWQATWRNWVRNQNVAKAKFTDIAKITVPSSKERDPALAKLDRDREMASPMPDHIREQIKSVLRLTK